MSHIFTVKLRWLELVGTIGASSTHPCVQAIPSLTIFKLVPVSFMSSWTPRFLLTKVAKRKWHLSLINNPLHAKVKLPWMFTTKTRIRLYRGTIGCLSLSTQQTMSGYYRPASETAFKCCGLLKNLCSQRLWPDCTIWCLSLSSQHKMSDHYRHAREMAFNCRFAGGPIVVFAGVSRFAVTIDIS